MDDFRSTLFPPRPTPLLFRSHAYIRSSFRDDKSRISPTGKMFSLAIKRIVVNADRLLSFHRAKRA